MNCANVEQIGCTINDGVVSYLLNINILHKVQARHKWTE